MKNPKPDGHGNIKSSDIKSAINGVVRLASENPRLKDKLFNEEFPIFLQINTFKVPKTKGPVKQVFRVPLANSPLPSDPDICLIVPDVKGIPNKEHERHIEHYETLLKSKDVTGIKKIMTFHEFRTEYDTFELKNRLVDLYDIFLVEGRISGKVVHKCGNIFYKKRKVPVAVKLQVSNLKPHFEQSLKKAFFQIHLKSDSYCVQIGHNKMKIKNLVENVYSVIEFIDKSFPGNMENIRSLNIYAHRGSSIPIYISLKNPNDIKVPVLSSKKPKAYKSFRGELTTQYNADVVVRPSGHVIVKRYKHREEEVDQRNDENITDAEIIRENKIIDRIDSSNDNDNKTKKGRKRKLTEMDDKSELEKTSISNDVNEKKMKKKRIPEELSASKGNDVKVKKEKNQKIKKRKLEGNNIKKSIMQIRKQNTIRKPVKTAIVKSKSKKKTFVKQKRN